MLKIWNKMLRTGLLIVLLLSIFSLDLMAQPKVDEQLAAEFFQQGDFAKARLLFKSLPSKPCPNCL